MVTQTDVGSRSKAVSYTFRKNFIDEIISPVEGKDLFFQGTTFGFDVFFNGFSSSLAYLPVENLARRGLFQNCRCLVFANVFGCVVTFTF